MSKVMEELRISGLQDVIDYGRNLQASGYSFRGQTNADWGITSSFERIIQKYRGEFTKRSKIEIAEKVAFVEFKRRAHHYINGLPDIKDNNNVLEWLALMQHYGCPTRLIDFTNSFYVALFFALEDSESDASVWALATVAFKIKWQNGTDFFSEKDIDSNYIDTKAPKNKNAYLIEPSKLNERNAIQQGLFLYPTAIEYSTEENIANKWSHKNFEELMKFDNVPKPAIVKVIIDKQLKLSLLKELALMNITAATLFPGLDGFARSLKLKILQLTDVPEDIFR
jgi:hypothetical protein